MDERRDGIPIAEAAARLGVTVDLLRKRAQRNTIPAYKVDGRWHVVLDNDQDVLDMPPLGDRQDRPACPGQEASRPHTEGASPAINPTAMAQLEAIRDQWLAPLIGQIREQAETIGHLAEAERRERERADALAARMDEERALADQLVDALERERDALLAGRAAGPSSARATRSVPATVAISLAPAEAFADWLTRPLRSPGSWWRRLGMFLVSGALSLGGFVFVVFLVQLLGRLALAPSTILAVFTWEWVARVAALATILLLLFTVAGFARPVRRALRGMAPRRL